MKQFRERNAREAVSPAANRRGKRTVLLLAFAAVLILLVSSAAQTYRIQQTQSRQAMEIYRRHVDQDVVLYRLRRTLWMASVSARDYLIDPDSMGDRSYHSEIQKLQETAASIEREFDQIAAGHEATGELREHTRAYWSILSRLPESTRGLSPAERFQFVHDHVAPRRNAAGDVLREFAEMTQREIRLNETEFELTQRNASNRLQTLLAFSLALGLLVAWLSLSHSEGLEQAAERQHRAVEQAREALKLLTGRLMSIQEEERARLSRELHDEIGQALATMRLEIVRAEGVCREKAPEALERLVRTREMAERTVATVRNMSALLRPSLLDDLGLTPALRALAEEFMSRTGMACSLSTPAVDPELPEPVATCVYRVVQESLHNCEKHSEATRVKIDVRLAGGWLVTEIADDGVGFQTRPSGPGEGVRLGIFGMEERAAAVGGRLETESAPGEGARIRLSVPCVPPEHTASSRARAVAQAT